MIEPAFHHRQNKNEPLIDRIRRDGRITTIRLLTGMILLCFLIGMNVSPRVSGQQKVPDSL
ncbi:MAG: hypothetical protein MUP70_02195, partial [Candidatus Aminicenantes bacterium]|nr:hypothetical protein [Candidatus Aminicenantes bacterium]